MKNMNNSFPSSQDYYLQALPSIDSFAIGPIKKNSILLVSFSVEQLWMILISWILLLPSSPTYSCILFSMCFGNFICSSFCSSLFFSLLIFMRLQVSLLPLIDLVIFLYCYFFFWMHHACQIYFIFSWPSPLLHGNTVLCHIWNINITAKTG